MKYVCIHGHFYQPDRTNPATGRLEPEPTAAPFSNWNDRIFSECYGVNASTPVVDGTQNNYHHLNTDFGPTLLRWMQRERPHTYEAILESNKQGAGQRYGTGNVMAQGYHHAILPLANPRDIETEIIWGIRDFEYRFKSIPEGFWLPETAVNTEVLDTLVRLGVEYVVLAPTQAKSIVSETGEHFGAEKLSALELSQRPYKIETPNGYITAFFYHGELAQSVAFGGVLNNGSDFANRLAEEARHLEPNALVHFATDGESYGHHHRHGNLALGHMIQTLQDCEDIQLTSYSAYLKENPASWTASIHENSAWSCAHGVGRWKEDCGCCTGGQPHWNQSWRGPLRSVLDWLRDAINSQFEKEANLLFKDPWLARNEYIDVILDPSHKTKSAYRLSHSRNKPWTLPKQTKAFGLLEMQRRLLNMYTSCGWFFDEISGLEPLQNIRHAFEAARLADQHLKTDLTNKFRSQCYKLPSNDSAYYHQQLDAIFKPQSEPAPVKSNSRRAGILLHISSLPSPFGIGDLGDGARLFVDWMVEAGVTSWQFLPLGPTDEYGSCYSSWSSLSGNPWLVDLRVLHQQGLLTHEELEQAREDRLDRVDFEKIHRIKQNLLETAATRFLTQKEYHPWSKAWKAFGTDAQWARDAGTFRYLKAKHDGKPWWEWPAKDRNPTEKRIQSFFKEGQDAIEKWMVQEFFFETQMRELRQYCEARGVELIGDVAMYVAGDSVDVWRQQSLFQLNAKGLPKSVAGAPPDAFNEDGQKWGNPIYDWNAMEADDYQFWIARFKRALDHADKVRFDHFRGLSAYWDIPATSETAKEGHWVQGPGRKIFDRLLAEFGDLPMIVEDLGDIDEAVYELRDNFGFPGMAVLQFGFSEFRTNEHTPCNLLKNSVAYTGTHDCDTTLGWWQTQSEETRDRVRRYCSSDGRDIVWDVIRMTLSSVADNAIVPMQDILSLGTEARMNTPGTTENNWAWRLTQDQLHQADHRRFHEMVELFGRNNRS